MFKGGANILRALGCVAASALFALSLCACSISAKDSAGGAPSNDTALQVTDRPSDTPAAGESGASKQAAASGKLEGATETTDKNGIVHGETKDGIKYTVHGRGEAAKSEDKVTLVAIGDQIGTDNSLPIAKSYGGGNGYDFTPFYKGTKKTIRQYDLRYMNQETVMAGGEYSGYPVFNTPDSAADAIHEVGFNLVNFATNHTYDMGMKGIERSHKVFSKYPELMIGGSYLTKEDRETVHMIERNGMTFAFLAYTYGDNHYAKSSDMPNDYYDCPFDKDAAKADIERAQKVADAVIVSMHWGTEYVNEPNDQQKEWAQYLADLDVDLVLGTHAHTLQPCRILKSKSGKQVPVMFGLSDFISGWTITDTIVSGLFTCSFAREDDGSVKVDDLKFTPAVEWSNGGGTYVRLLKDMDKATIDANTRTEDVSNDSAYFPKYLKDMGWDIPLDM